MRPAQRGPAASTAHEFFRRSQSANRSCQWGAGGSCFKLFTRRLRVEAPGPEAGSRICLTKPGSGTSPAVTGGHLWASVSSLAVKLDASPMSSVWALATPPSTPGLTIWAVGTPQPALSSCPRSFPS